MIPAYMQRPCPLITPRIQFKLAPPAPLPTLSTRTEFNPDCFKPKRKHVVIEEASPSKKVGFATTTEIVSSRGSSTKSRRSVTPEATSNTRPSKKARRSVSRELDEHSESSDEDDDSSNEPNTPPLAGPSRLIPKPAGEPGRPSSGGFSLEDVLSNDHQWSKSEVDKLLNLVRSRAQGSLDLTKSFSKQSKDKIQEVCNSVQKAMPQLARYDDCWPVRSALKLNLKYRSESSRRAQMKKTNERYVSAGLP